MPLVLAHRGANRLARENTLAAFRAAWELGADGVELDVRATADGVLVVHHDAEVEGVGPLAATAAAELPDWLPTLDEALEVCAPFDVVNVELKPDPATPGLAAAVAAALAPRPPRPRLLVSCFDLATLDAHRLAAPGVATGWLTVLAPGQGLSDGPAAAAAAAAVVAVVADRGHVAFHPHHQLVTPALVLAAHERDLLVATWTVNDPSLAAELAAFGVDVIISDVPDEVGRAVTRRA